MRNIFLHWNKIKHFSIKKKINKICPKLKKKFILFKCNAIMADPNFKKFNYFNIQSIPFCPHDYARLCRFGCRWDQHYQRPYMIITRGQAKIMWLTCIREKTCFSSHQEDGATN